jgi:hypothetical protein
MRLIRNTKNSNGKGIRMEFPTPEMASDNEAGSDCPDLKHTHCEFCTAVLPQARKLDYHLSIRHGLMRNQTGGNEGAFIPHDTATKERFKTEQISEKMKSAQKYFVGRNPKIQQQNRRSGTKTKNRETSDPIEMTDDEAKDPNEIQARELFDNYDQGVRSTQQTHQAKVDDAGAIYRMDVSLQPIPLPIYKADASNSVCDPQWDSDSLPNTTPTDTGADYTQQCATDSGVWGSMSIKYDLIRTAYDYASTSPSSATGDMQTLSALSITTTFPPSPPPSTASLRLLPISLPTSATFEDVGRINQLSIDLLHWLLNQKTPWCFEDLMPLAETCFRDVHSFDIAYRLDTIIKTAQQLVCGVKLESYNQLECTPHVGEPIEILWFAPDYLEGFINGLLLPSRSPECPPDEPGRPSVTRFARRMVSMRSRRAITRAVTTIQRPDGSNTFERVNRAALALARETQNPTGDVWDLIYLIVQTTTAISIRMMAHGSSIDFPSNPRIRLLKEVFHEFYVDPLSIFS